ncbi:MAG: diphthine--ammonia ligase [Defluviitaleaceae bacterium]|nr:diphthine--ammonia ligase [Defluviitaleaceae bacterium]
MKFAISYSGGKESALAAYRAIKDGHELALLITTYNDDDGHSHFHNLSEELLKRVSESLGVPLMLVKTNTAEYADNFESALLQAKKMGIQACVFGDIDFEDNRKWWDEKCKKAGLVPLFPLWGQGRKETVYEFIDSGFVATIATINSECLSGDFLGQKLTKELAERIVATGADICGENGEYHTFVSDGPIFRTPVDF